MSLTQSLVIGIINGLVGQDVEELVNQLPKNLGEEIGHLIKRCANDQTDSASCEIANWLDANRKKAADLAGFLLVGLSRDSLQETQSDSLIPKYLEVLNTIVGAMRAMKRGLVLRGFLHTDKILSYWAIDDYDGQVDLLEKDEKYDYISLSYRKPAIYLLDESVELGRLSELNLAIRKRGRLEHEILRNCPRVRCIRQFEIEADFLHGSIEIHEDTLGILEMILSLPQALAAQSVPIIKVQEQINEARKKGLMPS